MNKETGGPAFPAGQIHDSEPKYVICPKYEGMTLRDYFAAKAMQGILNDPSWRGLVCKTVAETAYEMADAMLKAREQ